MNKYLKPENIGMSAIMNKYLKLENLGMSAIIIINLAALVLDSLGFMTVDRALIILMVSIIGISSYLVALAKDDDVKNQKDDVKKIISHIYDQKDAVPFANHLKDSQFEFKKMACEASKSISIVGPSLKFLAEHKEIKELLFQKLKNDPTFKIRMLLSEPKKKEIVKVMAKYYPGDTYGADLEKSIQTFDGWKKEAEGYNPHLKLEIQKSDLIFSISLLFIDEDEPNARVMVTPIPYMIYSTDRPSFLIEKQQHEEAFNTYLNAYKGLFSNASSKFNK